jgi:hypothetical protein
VHPSDRSVGFDLRSSNGQQCINGFVPNGKEESVARLAFDTAKHALPLDSVASIILLPPELAFIDFDSLVTTADVLRAT